MATPNCFRCNGSAFQADNVSLAGIPHRLYFVYCASCGAVVSAMDTTNVGSLVGDIKRVVDQVAHDVYQVKNDVRSLQSR